jgi:hypothetical protein
MYHIYIHIDIHIDMCICMYIYIYMYMALVGMTEDGTLPDFIPNADLMGKHVYI